MDAMLIVVPLGLLAGVLTTLAGIGGGLVVTLVLAARVDPHHALAVAAPALLLGNAHRLVILRRHVDWPIAARVAIPGAIGALIGGATAAFVPQLVLRWLLLGVAGLAVVRERGWLPVSSGGPRVLTGGAALVGLGSATTGGGGLILAPLLLSVGLGGTAFVATGAAMGTSLHVARIAAYAGTGMFACDQLAPAGLLAAGIVAGNLLGRSVAPWVGERTRLRLTWATVAVGLGLAVFGLVA